MSLLDVTELTVDYTVRGETTRVVKGMSLEVTQGSSVGLVGESGSGKSAAVHAIAGLPRNVRTSIGGEVRLNGKSLLQMSGKSLLQMSGTSLRAIRGTQLAFVGQNPFGCLHPILPLDKQFHDVLRAHRRSRSRSQSRSIALKALESVGIRNPDTVLSGFAHQLSGGMAQRVVIAIATLLHPRLLIADEPTTALDPTVQVQILEVLDQLRREHGLALLVVTHDLGVVANYCDRALVMKDGEVVEHGPVTELFDKPQHPYTAELLNADSVEVVAS